IITEDIERRRAEFLALFGDRARRPQDRVDDLKELVFEHERRCPAMSGEPAKPAAASRLSLAIITEPGQANPFGTLHGGVLLRLADECGAITALRHVGGGRITTAALDAMTFLRPVYVGERVEIRAEITH